MYWSVFFNHISNIFYIDSHLRCAHHFSYTRSRTVISDGRFFRFGLNGAQRKRTKQIQNYPTRYSLMYLPSFRPGEIFILSNRTACDNRDSIQCSQKSIQQKPQAELQFDATGKNPYSKTFFQWSFDNHKFQFGTMSPFDFVSHLVHCVTPVSMCSRTVSYALLSNSLVAFMVVNFFSTQMYHKLLNFVARVNTSTYAVSKYARHGRWPTQTKTKTNTITI